MHVKSEITKDFNVHASIAPNWLELLPFKQRGVGSNPTGSTICFHGVNGSVADS